MSVNFGNAKLASIYFGNEKISKVYFGNQLVYTAEEDPVIITVDQGSQSLIIEASYPTDTVITSLTYLAHKQSWETPEVKILENCSIDEFNADKYNMGEKLEKGSRSISFNQDMNNPVNIDGAVYYRTTYTLSTPLTCTAGSHYLILARIGQYLSEETAKIGVWSKDWTKPHEGYSQYIDDIALIDGNYGKWRGLTRLSNPPWIIRT